MGLSITAKKFSAKHLNNDGLIKMNVKIAFQVCLLLILYVLYLTKKIKTLYSNWHFYQQFFGNTVRSAIETLAENKSDKYPELADCAPTLAFLTRINRFIDIMNSKMPRDALNKNDIREDVVIISASSNF